MFGDRTYDVGLQSITRRQKLTLVVLLTIEVESWCYLLGSQRQNADMFEKVHLIDLTGRTPPGFPSLFDTRFFSFYIKSSGWIYAYIDGFLGQSLIKTHQMYIQSFNHHLF